MVQVRVEAPVHPTESLAKVKIACLNVFPDLSFLEEGDRLVGETSSLDRLRQLVREQKIRDAVRQALLRGRHGRTTTFRLSKQAAYAGRVNLAAPSPLGDLRVMVEDEDLGALIDRLTAREAGRGVTGTHDRSGGT